MEGADQFHDRIIRHPCRRLVWVYVDGLRRSAGRSQILFDAGGFEFQERPVVPVADAIRVELEAIAWRDSLKDK